MDKKGHRSGFWKVLFLSTLSLFRSLPGQSLEAPVFFPAGGAVTSPTLLSIEHSNSEGVIFYTTNGTDPRDANGRVHRTARTHPSSRYHFSFGGPLSINRPMTVHARVKSGEEWSDLQVATFTVDQDFSQFLITEIMYHPTDLTKTPRNEEFIEFKNLSDQPLDLSGLRLVDFTDGIEDAHFVLYTFPEGVIAPPGEIVLLIVNLESFQSLYPGVPYDGIIPPPSRFVVSPFNNALGRIALVGPDESVVTQMRYESHAPWPVLPDNHGYYRHLPSPLGFSLTRATLDPKADPEHFSTWRASAARAGSPGFDDPEPNIPRLLINELRTRSNGEFVDAVEIYNPTSADVPIGGWWLSDERNSPYGFQFPPEMVVPKKGYLVVDEHDFIAAGSDLGFNSVGERCYLFSGDSSGELTGYSHGFRFFGNDRNASFGRVKSSDGDDYLLAEKTPSFGEENSGPILPRIMITEIMLHPEPGGFPYVEMQNITKEPVELWHPDDPEETWGFNVSRPVGLASRLPKNMTIPPGGFLVVVPWDVQHTKVPEHVQLIAFEDLFFADTRKPITLYRPSEKSGNSSRLVIEDQARYQNVTPWDPGAAGGGQGLERIGRTAFGNDPASWCAGPVGGTLGFVWEGNCSGHPIPELSLSTTRSQFQIQLVTEPGYRYSVEESFDLQTWSPTSITPIIGDGSQASFSGQLAPLKTTTYLRVVVHVHPTL